jgi:hypothetical protein
MRIDERWLRSSPQTRYTSVALECLSVQSFGRAQMMGNIAGTWLSTDALLGISLDTRFSPELGVAAQAIEPMICAPLSVGMIARITAIVGPTATAWPLNLVDLAAIDISNLDQTTVTMLAEAKHYVGPTKHRQPRLLHLELRSLGKGDIRGLNDLY